MTDKATSIERKQIDNELVKQAREEGSQRAYSMLMQFYWNPMNMVLLRLTGSATVADDLTMSSFTKAFSTLHKYQPQNNSSFYAWLLRIAINKGIDYLRYVQTERNSLQQQEPLDSYSYLPSTDDTPEESVIRQQRKMKFAEAIKQLDPMYSRLVEMRYFEDLSYQEICQETNLPISTVKIRLSRAKSMLKTLLTINEI